MAGIRLYLLEELVLGYTKKLAGIRLYLFRKLLLAFTKGNGWFHAVFICKIDVRVY